MAKTNEPDADVQERGVIVKDPRVKALAACMREINGLTTEKDKLWVIRSLNELCEFPTVKE